jgi:hypothetical protein
MTIELQDAGVECVNIQIGQGGELVKQSGSCVSDGRSLGVFIFAGTAERDDWLQVGSSFGSEVLGPNWVVIAQDDATAQAVAEALHGEVGTGE